jgi:hypothetical protein
MAASLISSHRCGFLIREPPQGDVAIAVVMDLDLHADGLLWGTILPPPPLLLFSS